MSRYCGPEIMYYVLKSETYSLNEFHKKRKAKQRGKYLVVLRIR